LVLCPRTFKGKQSKTKFEEWVGLARGEKNWGKDVEERKSQPFIDLLEGKEFKKTMVLERKAGADLGGGE